MNHVNPLAAPVDRVTADEKAAIAKEEWLASRGVEVRERPGYVASRSAQITKAEAISARRNSRAALVMLEAAAEYMAAAATALEGCMSTMALDGEHSPGWLDLRNAASEIAHARAGYVAHGNDPVAKLKSAGDNLGERRVAWFVRVADDVHNRIIGNPGSVPRTNDLPSPPRA